MEDERVGVTARQGLMTGRTRPLVVTITDIPIFYEAVAEMLGDQASVHPLKPVGGDTEVVLRALDPDAVIVDSRRGARDLRKATLKRRIPLIHVDATGSALRVLGANGWRQLSLPVTTSDALQSLLAAAALGKLEMTL